MKHREGEHQILIHPYPVWCEDAKAFVHHDSLFVPIDEEVIRSKKTAYVETAQSLRENDKKSFRTKEIVMGTVKQRDLKEIQEFRRFNQNQFNCSGKIGIGCQAFKTEYLGFR